MKDAYLVEIGYVLSEDDDSDRKDHRREHRIEYGKVHGNMLFNRERYYTLNLDRAKHEAMVWLSSAFQQALYAIVSKAELSDYVTEQDLLDGNVGIEDKHRHRRMEDIIWAAMSDGNGMNEPLFVEAGCEFTY